MPARKKKKSRSPSSPVQALRAAARALKQAKAARDAAFKALARFSKPGAYHIVDSSAAWMQVCLGKVRARLLAIEGVVGVGLGHRQRDGHPSREPCITVIVKHDDVASRIPRLTRLAKRILPIDVVKFGELQRQLSIGSSIGPSNARLAGTLGVFARDVSDNSSVAITAMHVSGLSEAGPASGVSLRFCTPSRFASNDVTDFADLVQGTMSRIDAAKLRVHSPQPVGGNIPGLGPIAGWRPLTFPGDLRTTVFLSGAMSGLQQGFIVNTAIDMPGERLESAILVNIPSVPGDSGSVLVDSQRFVVGFLVGAGNTTQGFLRIFCPAGLVFSELGCDIP